MNKLSKIIFVCFAFSFAALSAMETWNEQAMQSKLQKGVVVVDFYADWCAPCRSFAPTFEQVAKEMAGKAQFGKMNVDQVKKYNVTSIPTVIVFKDGKEFKRHVGGGNPQQIRDLVNSAL